MKPIKRQNDFSRRQFLALAGLTAAGPLILPGCATGATRRPRASERITVGVIGWGMQGPGNTRALLGHSDCQVVAACDLDRHHLDAAVNTINTHYKNQDCKAYHDYRELIAREDIDAVMIAVPDHWHALISIEAANHGKDIYGEKPLAKTIAEQQAIVRAVQRNKIIWQTGSWQRSEKNFRYAAEIVRNGLIGKVTRVEVGLPAGHNDFAKTGDKMTVTDPPANLDYETWIGPAQMQPYIEGRVHMNWRWNYNTGGGQLLDWIGHHCDIAHWGLDFDRSGPGEIEGVGEFPPADAIWNTCTKYRITAKYPRDIEFTIAGGHKDIQGGTKWIGTDGWVRVNRGNLLEASNPDWTEARELPEKLRKVKLYDSSNHSRNFLDCIKSRKPTITPVETAHHSAIPGHLGLIAMRVGRKIKWDVKKEIILDDPEASKLLTRDYRAPYHFA
ncbi:MAG: gfo/Idh/MocA family oxidoreductase [Verrucomicrobia bacterium]|nr:MAG: gfo/Idh/MocA family oxidoreductase [Verrucomicrobiota bacterium]